MPVGDSFKITNHMTLPAAKQASWGWGFRQTVGAAVVTAKQVGDAWKFLAESWIEGFYGTHFYNSGYTVMKAGAALAEVYEIKYGITRPGLRVPSSGPQATFNNAFVISKRTPFAGVKYRGRCFIPGVYDDDFLDTQLLDPAIFTALGALATHINIIMDNTNSGGIIPLSVAISSALIHPNPLAAHNFTSTEMTTAIPMRYVGSQRRRRVMIFT